MESKPTIKIIGPNISIFMLLGVVFMTLKLCKIIDWSWWLVLLPFYLPLGLFLVFALILSAIVTIGLWAFNSSDPTSYRLRRYRQGLRK